MFCKGCGQQVASDSAFCNRCGKPLAQSNLREGGKPPLAINGRGDGISNQANSLFRLGPKVWIFATILLLLIGAIFSFKRTVKPESTAPNSPPTKQNQADTVDSNRPTVSPPRFRFYRSKLEQGTSVVVSPSTSDEQLESLLWLFREKVRSHRFADIGITHPTSKRFGTEGYSAGLISVYRNQKCAGENFFDAGLGPCGYGDHSAAFYQWGLLVNGVFDPDADSAGITSSDGGKTEVFSYKDHWKLPAELQAKTDSERNSEETSNKVNRANFAEELERQLKAAGFDITVWVRETESDELVLNSDIFKDTATRVEFLSTVLPKWKHSLCKSGFRQIRLIRGGLFSTGDVYSVGCN